MASVSFNSQGVWLKPAATDTQRQIGFTDSIGNQSPQSNLTLSMSSWQRSRSWTSLRAVGDTTSVIHTCGDQWRTQDTRSMQEVRSSLH